MSTSFSFKTDKLNNQQIEPKKRQMKKIQLILLSISLGILLIFFIFSDNAIKLYENYFVNDHHEVVTYIEKIDRYNSESTEIVESIGLKLYKTDLREYGSDVKKAKVDLQQLIDQTVALTPPQGFNQHKGLFIAVLNQRMVVLSTYNNTRKTYVFQDLNTAISELNQKQNIERKTLLKAFKNAGIKYKQIGADSIRYWFKSHSAKSFGSM
jgi:hypothetical protein